MSELGPLLTIVIAARPDEQEVAAVAALRQQVSSQVAFEVIVVRGSQPSRQRNMAVEAAKGEVIYFLDDDSLVGVENLTRLVERFADPKVAVVGGPNLCPAQATRRQHVFADLMASRWVFGPSSARYRQVGPSRQTTEKELILCNMAVRREPFNEVGGFDLGLYPNEENALLDQLMSRGHQLWYDPALVVERFPRATVRAFLVMVFRYGRGRGEQVRRHPTRGSLLNVMLGLFVIYECGLGAALVLIPENLFTPWGIALTLPFCAYLLLAFSVGVASVVSRGMIHGVGMAIGMMATHFSYGLGFWRGLMARVAGAVPHEVPVTVERVLHSSEEENH